MALKYTLHVSSQKLQDWLVEIDVPDYTGDPIELVGDRNPILIEWNSGTTDNPFSSHVIPQSATFRVYSDGLDIQELQLIDDASVKCRVYLNSELKHQGFIVSDGIQEPDNGVSALVTIRSIDGLELLDAIPFVWGDNYGLITVDGQQGAQRCPMNALRLAIYRFDMLDNVLPIRWATSLKSNQYPTDDMLAGRNKINYDGKLTTSGARSAFWYIENICKTAQCWFYQRDGYWYIENRGDTIRNGGVMNGYEITTSTSAQVATAISIDLNTTDLSLEFINQDAYWMTKKPLGGVNVIYDNAMTPSNVLPNGSMDNWSLGALMDWGWRSNIGDGAMEQYESLQNRDGSSVRLYNFDEENTDAVFAIQYQIPVDTKYLFKSFLFGFTFMPLNGFPYNSSTGIINWSDNPLKISVAFKWQDKFWHLNEFGYWQYQGRGLDLGVQFVRMIVTYSDFPSPTYTFQALFEGNPNVGDVLVISIRDSPGGEYVDYSYTVTINEENWLEEALNKLLQQIPSSIDGYSITNKAVVMSNATNGYVRFAYAIYLGEATGRTYKGGSTQEYRYIYPFVDNMKIGDVSTVPFVGKGGNSEILIPQIEELQQQIEGGVFPNYQVNGIIDVRFYVEPNQSYVLDDVYMSFPKNNDLYELRVSGSKSPIDDYEVGISSSFTGFMWSNYMDDYGKSNRSMFWGYGEGGLFDKTLTQLYGEFILDWRNKPRRIFDGSIDRVVQCGDFLTIKGVKYVVLNVSVEGDGISKVLAFEASLSSGLYSVTHKGSEDEEQQGGV